MNIIEITSDTARNSQLHFPPIGRTLRGRIDFGRMAETDAMKETKTFPNGIPGQRLTLDLESGEAAIVEPLQDPKYREVRGKIEKRKFQIPPEREVFTVAPEQYATWLFWIMRFVESGLATLTRQPNRIKLTGKVRKRFVVSNAPDPKDERIRCLEEEGRAYRRAMMTPEQRKCYDAEMEKIEKPAVVDDVAKIEQFFWPK